MGPSGFHWVGIGQVVLAAGLGEPTDLPIALCTSDALEPGGAFGPACAATGPPAFSPSDPDGALAELPRGLLEAPDGLARTAAPPPRKAPPAWLEPARPAPPPDEARPAKAPTAAAAAIGVVAA